MLRMKNQMIQGTLILTIAGFITRLIGFAYRVYLSDTIGNKLLGIYQLIFPVYGICFTIYASGIQTAISQKIASNTIQSLQKEFSLPFSSTQTLTQKKEQKDRLIFKTGLFASLILAFLLSLLVFSFSKEIAAKLLLEPTCSIYLKILCILFPFCGISACINGFFYGKKEARYPAVSQIVEQLARVSFVVILCTLLPVSTRMKSYFAVCGLVMGEAIACFYNIIRFIAYQKTCKHTLCQNSKDIEKTKKEDNFSKTIPSLSVKKLAFSILFLASTLTGTKLIISLLHSAESVFIPAALRQFGYTQTHALSTYGILSGVAMPFILFPSAITNSFAVMLLPSIAQAAALNQKETIQKYVSLSGKYSLYIGYFFSCIFLLFGHEFGVLLFQSAEAGTYITLLSFICPALYLSTTFTSIINGLGATQITFFITVISLGINIASLVFFVPHYGLLAYLAGSVLSDYIMVLLEGIYLHSYIKLPFFDTTVIPICILAISGFFALKGYSLLLKLPFLSFHWFVRILCLFFIILLLGLCYLVFLYIKTRVSKEIT